MGDAGSIPAWKLRARQKRAEQAALIPPEWRLPSMPSFTSARDYIRTSNLLSPAELEITEITDARVLQQRLHSRSITALAVATAFCKRAAIAQQLTGCLTEIFFDRALTRARELDEYFEREGKPVGPLHGIPISFKDNYDVEGMDSTIGWIGLIGRPVSKNSPGVDMVLRLGGIIYVKTNIPQSLMMSDSYNHVFKQSVNSLNSSFISGGSSGGEGAIVGALGSIIGVGTDIGGSVRIPAVLQGLYGLNPTIGRFPNDSSGKNQKYVVPPVGGPLTTSISSLEFFMDTLLSSEPWDLDPGLLPVPWRRELAEISQKPLKLAFIFDDGVVKPQPPVERAAREIYKKLENAGHEVFEWDVSSHAEGYALWLKAVLADGGEDCRKLCELAGEPLVEGMLVGLPEHTLTVTQRRELEDKKTEYQKDYLQRWKESGIDAIIMPVLPWVAYPPKTWVKSKQSVAYTALWNCLNYTSLAIPAIVADKSLDQPDQEWINHVPRNPTDDFNHKQYDINLVDGMPVGLQIVTGRFGEEKAVSIAKVIQGLQ